MAVKDISSIVVSSRVRLARNLDKMPMPPRLNGEKGYQVLKKVVDSVKGLDEFKIYTIKQLPEADAHVMQEKHLISNDLLEKQDFGAVILNADESISIMVNEEDHLREQCFLRGLELEKAFETLNDYDNKMLSKLDVAFSEQFGFLTSCITNLGTGMRASVMMFLPALTLSGEIRAIISSLQSRGLCVRGIYGESTGCDGYMYQISNARSLGVNEKEIIGSVKEAVLWVCELENRARQELLKSREIEVTDKVYRAYGVLCNCYTLSSHELMQLAGEVKMGIALGLLRLKDNGVLDRLSVECMPYSLSKIAKSSLEGDQRDLFRAKYVNSVLKNQRIK